MAKTPGKPDAARSAGDSTRTMTENVAEKARETVGDAVDTASHKARVEAEQARDTAAEEVQKTANAADAAADEFDENSIQARAIEEVASRIDDLAEQIRGQDIDRVARMVGDAARRHPMMFVAGAALAGFAVTRFLKARDPARRADYGDDPWSPNASGHVGIPPRSGEYADPLARGGI